MQKIIVDRGEVIRIATLFNCTDQTVRNALRFVTEGEQPDRIRAEAIRSGGVLRKRQISLKTELSTPKETPMS